MKGITLRLMVAMLLALPGNPSDSGGSSVLTVEVREKIRMLADEHPSLLDIFLPEQPDEVKVPLSSVPKRAKTHAAAWISRVVRERWLPADIQTKVGALKDVKLREKRDKNGSFIPKVVGDFLMLDYEVSGHGVHVHESGISVSLRVDFPESMPVGDDPGAFITKCVRDFLNLSEDIVSQLQGDVKEYSPVYVAYLRTPRVIQRELAIRELTLRIPPGQPFEIDEEHEIWKGPRQWQWWDRVHVFTNGRFFFVAVVEAEPVAEGRYNPRAKGGLPDRF